MRLKLGRSRTPEGFSKTSPNKLQAHILRSDRGLAGGGRQRAVVLWSERTIHSKRYERYP